MPPSSRKTSSSQPPARVPAVDNASTLRASPRASAKAVIDPSGALPAGCAVGSFVLQGLVERDDFNLRYRATSSASDAEVLIEEYWPAAWVERAADRELTLREAGAAPSFTAGLEAFVDEAEQLARLDHPALVKIGPVWRLRGTAYRLRPELPARRLGQDLLERARPLDEPGLRALAETLLGALQAVHGAGRIHGNLRPGNVALREDDSPVLLDFGAAAVAIARLAPWRAAQPEPAFAAPELQLYGQRPTPAADLYSLAAVLWLCSTGELPETAGAAATPERRWQDLMRRYPSLRLSAAWKQTLASALAFAPAARPQNVDDFRRSLAASPEPSRVQGPVAEHAEQQVDDTAVPARGAEPGLPVDPPQAAPTLSAAWQAPWPSDVAVPPRGPGEREPIWQIDELAAGPSGQARPSPDSTPGPGLAPSGSGSPPLAPRAPPPRPSPLARTEDTAWPRSARSPVFDAPNDTADAHGAPPAHRARVAPKTRTWAWALGGVLVGGAAVLGLGFGLGGADSELRLGGPAPQVVGGTTVVIEPPPAPLAAGDRERADASAGDPAPMTKAAPIATVELGSSRMTAPVRTTPEAARNPPAPAPRVATQPVTDPAAVCAPRRNFSLFLCMKTQCERAAWYAHPQCVQFRLDEEP